MSCKSILIVSVSAGAGHVRAAEALRETAAKYCPGVEAVHIDLMQLVQKLFRRLYADSYATMVEHQPSLWGYLYQSTDHPGKKTRVDEMREAFERFNVRKLRKTVEKMRPGAVICTHFLPAQFLSQMIRKGELECPVWVTVTDFDVHSMWVQERMAGYFAASDEVAWRMRDRGIDPRHIHVTGVPISPAFSQTLDREDCARELGLNPEQPTIFLLAGAAGNARALSLAERLSSIPGRFQLVAGAGRNEELLAGLKALALAHPGRVFPLGFTRTIERVMKACDLVITKPGGLITSECLAMGLPMILISKIPGQEERNASHLLEHGAALEAYDEAGLDFRVRKLLAEPRRLEDMRHNALGLGRPRAARDILDIVMRE